MLGGLRYLIPVIEAAHELGHYVITCDNVLDNYDVLDWLNFNNK
jgi:hypothetical protein